MALPALSSGRAEDVKGAGLAFVTSVTPSFVATSLACCSFSPLSGCLPLASEPLAACTDWFNWFSWSSGKPFFLSSDVEGCPGNDAGGGVAGDRGGVVDDGCDGVGGLDEERSLECLRPPPRPCLRFISTICSSANISMSMSTFICSKEKGENHFSNPRLCDQNGWLIHVYPASNLLVLQISCTVSLIHIFNTIIHVHELNS